MYTDIPLTQACTAGTSNATVLECQFEGVRLQQPLWLEGFYVKVRSVSVTVVIIDKLSGSQAALIALTWLTCFPSGRDGLHPRGMECHQQAMVDGERLQVRCTRDFMVKYKAPYDQD